MTWDRSIAALVCLMLLFFVPSPAGAQVEPPINDSSPVLDFELSAPQGVDLVVPAPGSAQTYLRIQDTSRDSVPPPTVGGGGTSQDHQYRITYTPQVNDTGWTVIFSPASFSLAPGGSMDVLVQMAVTPQAYLAEFPINVTVTMEPQICCGEVIEKSISMAGTTDGLRGLTVTTVAGGSFVKASPDESISVDLQIQNPAVNPKTLGYRVLTNTCNLEVLFPTTYVGGTSSTVASIHIHTPAESRLVQTNCLVEIEVFDTEGFGKRTVPITVQIQGAYVDPGWIVNAVIIVAVIGLVIWLILLAKRRAEEEVLGKPQPPWTLPAEQVYLAELQKKDPQAAYVVRHFLMEDEYASSLLWYKAYKKATKGRRKAERKALKIEHEFEKWDLRMQAQLADTADTDKQVAKLQAKLDRSAKKSHKKDLKKWKKQVSKLETKAANDHNKAMNEYRKAAKKAAKKGEPAPKQPVMAHPELPSEPQFESIDVDTHPRGSRKKQRILDRASQNEARAEANYERLRAKKLDVTQRKLAKLAEAIDDPAFVDEHPMLRDAVSASA